VSSPVQSADPAVRPRALRAATSTPGRALLLAGVAGAGVALQVYLNGRLSRDIHSVEVASAVNNGVGLIALLALALAGGSLRRAGMRIRAGAQLRPWFFAGGAFSAMLIIGSTAAAPKVGVALVTVALVCGQTTGSLGVDAAGIGPAGRRGASAPRVLGVVLAIAAVGISAFAGGGHVDVVLLAVVLVAGMGSAVQQAVAGRLAVAVGEPVVAALVTFAGGFATMTVVAIAAGAGDMHVAGPPLHWLGGLLGAFFAVVAAAAVGTLGVLRLMLVVVAGQMLGAVAVDLAAPVAGEPVGVATIVGVALTLAAVWVSGRAQRPANRDR
jgi:transporter family-2 protein